MMPSTTVEVAAVPREPIRAGFRLGAVGDLMYLRPMSATLAVEQPDLVRLLGSVDLLFGNLETTLLDLAAAGCAPAAASGGSWLLAEPEVAADLAALGFGLVSLANNHAGDWGTEGLLGTLAAVRAAGITAAGAGTSLSGAIAPRYVDTAFGRVALVSATTTFTEHSRAGDPLGEIPARPGVAAIRSSPVATVPDELWHHLHRFAARHPSFLNLPGEDELRAMGGRFRRGTPGDDGEVRYEPDPEDVAAVLLAVRQARQNSNLVVFSLHSHEPSNDDTSPAAFAADLCRRAVDAGADLVVGHGPHQLRGVEVRDGVPILHSLGDFAMMSPSLDVVPLDTWRSCRTEPGAATVPELLHARNQVLFASDNVLESAVASMRWDEEGTVLQLHPLDLGRDRVGAARGVPGLARGPRATRIVDRLVELSSAVGTTLQRDEGRAVLRLPARRVR
ncbi:CapA family protein [Nocardioides nitrophenolicus]|uniref:CapA family protein n=1 Tax=Nocardioides nitrophenolicus TaxID=60489 RepID=UPI0019580AA0|nr:CapA family protein [Nocardioides nitrophenolicus]MBM7517084.1 poly-gamma-glutamate synthesis protein (capsule biosynthesis protein) [Nocardioides nitrophenolicus]